MAGAGWRIYGRRQQRFEEGVPTTEFYTGDDLKGIRGFPDDYALYVLDAKDLSGGNWDQGSTRGVAVSTQRHEVVYWADYW